MTSAELFERYNALLVHEVLASYRNQDVAEEAASRVWLNVLRARTPLPTDERHVRNYLVLSAVREGWDLIQERDLRREQLARNGLRRLQLNLPLESGAEQGYFVAAPGPSVEEEALNRVEAREMLRCIAGFTEAERRPWAGYLAGGTYEEVGEMEMMSYTAVNRHLVRGKRRIRAALS